MSLKMQELMQAEDMSFETDSLNDFKVPLFMFRQYCNAVKGLKHSLQDVLLNALGVKTTTDSHNSSNEEAAHVGWDPFIQLNCFVLFQSCDQKSFAEFFTKIMDPDNQKVVPKRDANNRLNLLFSGDFKDTD